jgi:hypothetical protein
MGGIGIRYAHFARLLPTLGFEVVLVCPDPDVGAMDLPLQDLHRFRPGGLAQALAGCDAVVAQGQIANNVVREVPELPSAIDLYDPWLVENLHYAEALGHAVYRNDHASWLLQMGQGDFFLCSSQTQRLFYLGFLTAVGRLAPGRLAGDPDLDQLIAVVPFGLPGTLPAHRPVLPASDAKRILFGGVYDWYDPWTLLHAVAKLPCTDWQVLFMRNPNPETTPQVLAREIERECAARAPWKGRVQFLDWVPDSRRFDLMRDVSVLAAPHRPTLETRLSMRTRFLDALAAGCPVVMTEGDDLSRLVAQHDAGWTVPPGDTDALAEALTSVFAAPDLARSRRANGEMLARLFQGPDAIAPLVGFCRDPRIDLAKDRPALPRARAPLGRRMADLLHRTWPRPSGKRPER